jgi:hypothetical protein
MQNARRLTLLGRHLPLRLDETFIGILLLFNTMSHRTVRPDTGPLMG